MKHTNYNTKETWTDRQTGRFQYTHPYLRVFGSLCERVLASKLGQGTVWCSPQGPGTVSHFWLTVWGSVHKHTWWDRYQVGLTHCVKECSRTTVSGQGTAGCSPQGIGKVSHFWFLMWGSVHKHSWSGRYQVGLTHCYGVFIDYCTWSGNCRMLSTRYWWSLTLLIPSVRECSQTYLVK